jgi:heptaprenyl diphosphate synthase
MKSHTDYDMIVAYTDVPQKAVSRGVLLGAFLTWGIQGDEEGTMSGDMRDELALATVLLQTGLDIHDWINQEADADVASVIERRRQLRVLAGDFFSAQFYRKLAKAGQVQLIQDMMQAVCRVNEMKLTHYTNAKVQPLSLEALWQHEINIRMQLFQCFTGLIHKSHRALWEELLLEATTYEWASEQLHHDSYSNIERDVLQQWVDSARAAIEAQLANPKLAIIREEIASILD